MHSVAGRTFRKAFAANKVATAFTAKVPTVTKPINDGIIDLNKDGIIYPWNLKILPYGLGSANDVYSLRMWGWSRIHASDPLKTLWVPAMIGEWVCTLGATTGVAGSPVLNTELFCDTIAPVALMVSDYKIGAGTSVHSEMRLFTPANDTPAHIVMPVDGWEMIEFDGDQTTNTPEMNALIALLGPG